MARKLSEDKIRKLKWDATKRTKAGNAPKFQWHDDPEVAGHHIRLYPPKASGQSSKVFYVKYGPDVGRKVYRIGPWGEWPLQEARDRARRVSKDFYSKGIDPNQSRQEKIQQAKAKLTVKELADEYIEAHPVPVWSLSYRKANETHAKKLTKDFGSRLAETLGKDDLRPLFVRIKKDTPAQAKLFRGFVNRMYDWGMDEELLPDMINPAILVRSKSKAKSQYQDPPAVERDRVLESDKGEATALFDMLKDYDPLFTHMAKLYLLLGFRNAELREADWAHIDLDNRLIKNVQPKGGEQNSYRAYLCDMAIDCLKGLGLGKIEEGPIFPAEGLHKSVDEPRSNWSYWYRTISKDPRMPLSGEGEHIQIHDLRRTAITWLQEMRCDDDERTIFKGSRPSGVTARNYSHGKREYVHQRCTLAIEERLLDVLAGREKTMFDPWRNPKQTTGPAS